MNPPVGFVFGAHFHQPVGNFDHVFEQHLNDVYRPLIDSLIQHRLLPFTLHISGPLLEWLEGHAEGKPYLDQIGRLVADGQLELLLAGFYEPVLASLPRADRLEQISWLKDALKRRFGADATGLWLTERVWEPDLAADLADAGVKYALVDDRHFLVSGFARERLHAPFWTESGGKRVALFPIDEKLRYLVPFKPPATIADYFRELQAAHAPLAVLVDDGEKFGGWPGTKDWVYTRGWLAQFADAIAQLVKDGTIRLTTSGAALRDVPAAGLAYLPTASYREMEAWSLPPDGAARLAKLEHELGEERVAGPDGALLRGSHWRNFLAKYPESNRMHKKMLALSALARAHSELTGVRRAIGRAQCNDAYWHGVFGGLYLPHLREAIWKNLAQAERELRKGERIVAEQLDFDYDGAIEVWVHSSTFSAVVSPKRGGVIEEYTLFASGINYADVLTRRREPYHEIRDDVQAAAGGDATPSIHDIERASRLTQLPPVDEVDRALFVDRVVAADGSETTSWARTSFEASVEVKGEGVDVVLRVPSLEKRLSFDAAGTVTVSYRWDPAAFPPDASFCTEISVTRKLELDLAPTPVVTVSRSERGFEETVQGYSYTQRWAASAGEGRQTLNVR